MTMDTTATLAAPFLLVRSQQEMHDLLTDLLTPEEIARFAARWESMRLSTEGLTREEIKERVGVSLTTISRARRSVEHGTGIIGTLAERLDQSPGSA